MSVNPTGTHQLKCACGKVTHSQTERLEHRKTCKMATATPAPTPKAHS